MSLYGEILLALNRPEQAAEKFEMSLLRMQGRARSLLGAARAAAAAGDRQTADEHYSTLLGSLARVVLTIQSSRKPAASPSRARDEQ